MMNKNSRRLTEMCNNLFMAGAVSTMMALPGAAFSQNVNQALETVAENEAQLFDNSFLDRIGSPFDFQNPLALLGIPASILLLNHVLRSRALKPKDVNLGPMFIIKQLTSKETAPTQMPWQEKTLWYGMAVVAFGAAAGLEPNRNVSLNESGPALIVVDNNYASAANWGKRHAGMKAVITSAYRDDRNVVFLETARRADGGKISLTEPMSPAVALSYLETIEPMPWLHDLDTATQIINDIDMQIGAAFWFSDSLQYDQTETFARSLNCLAPLSVYEDQESTLLMMPPEIVNGEHHITIKRADIDTALDLSVSPYDVNGNDIGTLNVRFAEGESEINFIFPEDSFTRNIAVFHFAVDGYQSVASTAIVSDNFKPKSVGIVTAFVADPQNPDIGTLLDERRFIYAALSPHTEIYMGQIETLIAEQNISVMALPDSITLHEVSASLLEQWVVNDGGTLVRFAGPNLTKHDHLNNSLLPVDLRKGFIQADGSLNAIESSTMMIEPILPDSPLYGIELDPEISLSRQLNIQLSPDLDEKTWVSLSDGSPLVTADERGRGRVILIHAPANTNGGDLALSRSFEFILRGVVEQSNSIENTNDFQLPPSPPLSVLNGRGEFNDPSVIVQNLNQAVLDNDALGPENPPGLYGTTLMQVPYNVSDVITDIYEMGDLPQGVSRESYSDFDNQNNLRDYLWAGAIMLMLTGVALLGRRRSASYDHHSVNDTPVREI